MNILLIKFESLANKNPSKFIVNMLIVAFVAIVAGFYLGRFLAE